MDATFDLGTVTAPSGVLVLGMAGWIDYWPRTGRSLGHRASAAAADGGGHLRDGLCEAVAAPAATGTPLAVRAATSPSPFDGEPTIAVLEVDLGVPWAAGDRDVPIRLGDLPVDRCGMVLGDARALESFVGLDGATTDGLADLFYWGGRSDDVHGVFGGEATGRPGGSRGWLDLPVADARRRAIAINAWAAERTQARGVVVAVDEHNDYTRFTRAGWDHPLPCGAIDVAGCRVLGIKWDQGDHSMRHRGERQYGQVYAVTLHRAPNTAQQSCAGPYRRTPRPTSDHCRRKDPRRDVLFRFLDTSLGLAGQAKRNGTYDVGRWTYVHR